MLEINYKTLAFASFVRKRERGGGGGKEGGRKGERGGGKEREGERGERE